MGFLKGGAHKRYLRQCFVAFEEQKRDHLSNYMPSALFSLGTPAKHEWLWPHPLARELVNRLERREMFSYCASIEESLIP
ncbi:hypothetical protein CsSME_00050963 [Camellia sinensis var. sinensis]